MGGTIDKYDASTGILSLSTSNGTVQVPLAPTARIRQGWHKIDPSELEKLVGYRATDPATRNPAAPRPSNRFTSSEKTRGECDEFTCASRQRRSSGGETGHQSCWPAAGTMFGRRATPNRRCRAFALWCPALVIADLEMPLVDGIELCRRVRRDRRTSPIIVVSGNSDGRSEVGGARCRSRRLPREAVQHRHAARPGAGGAPAKRGRRRRHRRSASGNSTSTSTTGVSGSRTAGSPDAEGIRPVRVHGPTSEPRARAPDAARCGVG